MTHLLILAHGVPCCGPGTWHMVEQAGVVLGIVAAVALAAWGVAALAREVWRHG